MTISSLCTYTHITNNKSNGRAGNRVCKITPHYMAAKWSGKQCADYFASTNRQASSNYCIGVDGDIACSVDENDRAWTSSSAWNDRRSITIECGNIDNGTGEMTQATWNALVNLCVDICRRYGFRLNYTGRSDGSLTEHRMFSSTDCPGKWLHARMQLLADTVNAKLDGNDVPTNSTTTTPAPSNSKTATSNSENISADGWWGSATTRKLQQVLGTPVDGIVSGQYSGNKACLKACTSGWDWNYSKNGSTVIREMQRRMGVTADGIMGRNTVKALQRRMGTYADGSLWGPSPCIVALQNRLNNGTF